MMRATTTAEVRFDEGSATGSSAARLRDPLLRLPRAHARSNSVAGGAQKPQDYACRPRESKECPVIRCPRWFTILVSTTAGIQATT